MKRGLDMAYICTSTPTKTNFQQRPNFKFSDSSLPKLVDYSFTDDSDSGNDSKYTLDESWDRLQASLDSLTSGFSSLETSRTPLQGFSRHLHERASLRLKAEQEKEAARKSKVLDDLNQSFKEKKRRPSVRKPLTDIFGHLNEVKTVKNKVTLARQVKSCPSLVTSEDTSITVCDMGQPAKKRKLNFGVFSRFSMKRLSFKSRSKKSVNNQLNSPPTNCLFGCFKASASYKISGNP